MLFHLTFNTAAVLVCVTAQHTNNENAPLENQNRGNKHEGLVKSIGCTYVNDKQLIRRNVCLMPGYEANERPPSKGLTPIYVDYSHAEVTDINEEKHQLTISVVQEMQWLDSRIRVKFPDGNGEHNESKIPHKKFKEMWHPDSDIYTLHLKSSNSIYANRLFEEVYIMPDDENGHSESSKLIALKDWELTIQCKFDFSNFPLDTQPCQFLQMGGEEFLLQLVNNTSNETGSVNGQRRTNGFEVTITRAETLYLEGTNGVECIGFNITLDRVVRVYLFQYYFPSIAIVVVSLISFIIPVSATPGRVALMVTQFLTLTNIFIHLMVYLN